MSSSKDTRSLYDKLISLATDPGATSAEREAACKAVERMDLKQRKATEAQRLQKNAGGLFKPEVKRPGKRMRRAYLKPRSQRVNKAFFTVTMREAQERAKYRNDDAVCKLFGFPDEATSKTNAERRTYIFGEPGYQRFNGREEVQKIIDLLGTQAIERHICLINGKVTRLFMFWTYGVNRDIHWFFIERDVTTGKTLKSKRYFTRDGAMEAFDNDHITWVKAEYIS